MFIWTSSPVRLVAALMGAAFLTYAQPVEAMVDRQPRAHAIPATRLPVAQEAVVISAPFGYCIDPLGSVTNTRDAFVLLAPCLSVGGGFSEPASPQPGVLTASVLGKRSDDVSPVSENLAEYFASSQGRAVLSRSGNPASLTISRTYSHAGVFFVHAIEPGGDGAIGDHSWRAIFEVNGCMVTATLRDLNGQPISDVNGFSIVQKFVDQIVTASQRP